MHEYDYSVFTVRVGVVYGSKHREHLICDAIIPQILKIFQIIIIAVKIIKIIIRNILAEIYCNFFRSGYGWFFEVQVPPQAPESPPILLQ